jgi:hypothetical protein
MRKACLLGDVNDFSLVSSFLKSSGANLHDLSIEECAVNVSPLCCIASLLCSHLLILELSHVSPITDGSFEQLLSSCAPTLEELHLENVVIGFCAVTCKLLKLRLLLLSEANVGAEGLSSLLQNSPNMLTFFYDNTSASRQFCPSALAACTKLRNIVYTGTSESDASVLCTVLRCCRRIAFLDVDGSDRAMERLLPAVASHCRNLRALSLHGLGGFTSADIATIEARLNKLEHLSIHNLRCENDLPLLTLAKHCRGLRSLALRGLSGTYTDGALVTLLSSLPALEELDLKECGDLSDAAMAAIGDHCPHLWQLCMRGCAGFTVTGMLSIVRGCTTLKKVHYTDDEHDEHEVPVIFAHFARELWKLLRPGIVFLQSDNPNQFWLAPLTMLSSCRDSDV